MRRMTIGIVALALMLATAGAERAWAAKLTWATYIGGSQIEYGRAFCTDPDGNIYLTGYTNSPGWASGGGDATLNGLSDAYAMKLSPAGTPLWSTYLGGDGAEQGAGIAVDAAGAIYVCGQTQSAGWLSGAFDSTYNASGGLDGFLVKLSSAGQIVWGAYLGGEDDDYASNLAIDGAGDLCVVGSTFSEGWLTGGYDAVYNDGRDGFALKVSAAGQRRWGTYLGGDMADYCSQVTVDGSNNLYVAGQTQSPGWVSGGFKTAYTALSRDAYVAKLTPQGAHVWSTYLSGRDATASGLAIDRDGNLCVVGNTSQAGWAAGGPATSLGGYSDGYLMKLTGGGQFLWGENLGGSGSDYTSGLFIDAANQITVCGTTSSNFWLSGGFDHILGLSGASSSNDAYVLRLTPDGRPVWGSYLGGDYSETVAGIAPAGPDGVLVFGDTSSSSWITTPGMDTTRNGTYDGFLARIDQCGQVSSGSLAVTITPPEAVTAGAQWRRAGTTTWRDSGATEPGVPYGHYALELKPLTGWARPAGTYAVDVDKAKNAWTAPYAPGGLLKVTIEPPEARASGAKWRTVGALAWRDSDTTASEVTTGTLSIEFKPVDRWTTPNAQTITIRAGQTTATVGLYGAPQAELAWGAYLGRNNPEAAYGVALDQWENVYVTGYTWSDGWVSGGADTTISVGSDAFVAKLSSKGQHLWSTYLGGFADDYGYGIAVDSAGNACVTGSTNSSGWLTGGYNPYYGGTQDGFALKLAPGGQMLWGTYLGDSHPDSATAIAVDKWDYLYITGQTYSGDWLSGPAKYVRGPSDAFVVKLGPQGAQIWGMVLGSYNADAGRAIAIDRNAGALYVAGDTCGGAWGLGSYGRTYNGGASDAFLAKLTLSGALTWSSFLGGKGAEHGYGLALDGSGNILVCGDTDAGGWARNGYDTTSIANDSVKDGFAAKVAPTGQQAWSTYLGGDNDETARGVVADGAGNLFVTGFTISKDWVSGGFNTILDAGYIGGTGDAYVIKLSGAGGRLWSSYLGESQREEGYAIARGGSGDIYIAGLSQTDDWLAGGCNTLDRKNLTPQDNAFVARVRDITQPGRGALRIKMEPLTLGVNWRRFGQAQWRMSDTTEYNIPAGAYEIEFNVPASSRAAAPQPLTLTVADGRTTTATVQLVTRGGAVTVNITPPEAVAQGAKWRLLNSKAWLESGAALGDLAASTGTICFSEVAGMAAPSPLKLPLRLGQTTSATVRYLYPGALNVKLTPPEAVAAGAQWRIKGLAEWHDSGTTASVPLGAQAVEFKGLIGWTQPNDVPVTVTLGSAAMASGTYARQYGSLQVSLSPAGAMTAGAQWRRTGTTAWLDSGVREDNVEAGPVGIEFKPVAQWGRPQVTTVTVSQGQLTQHTGAYTRAQAGLVWSTYLGGGQSDSCEGVATGPGETAYVTGVTSSTGWISGGLNGSHHGGTDAFVSKYSMTGQLLWSAYLGGDKDDSAYSLAVDGAGEVCITGETYSSGWVSGGFDTNYRGARDAYVVKLSATGRHRWSALLGDTGEDRPRDIAIDGGSGAVCVTGYTTSHGWLIGGPDSAQRKFESAKRGVNDVFVAKLSAEGQRLWTADLGGAADDYGYGIAVDGAGNLYITGRTASGGWLARGSNTTLSGGDDAFVLKLSPGGVMLWGTYLGGAGDDIGSEIAVDALGNIWAVGATKSAGWVSGGYQTTFGGPPWDGWLARLSSAGRPVWSTYIGGAGHDECLGVDVDITGAAYVTGDTQSTGWTTHDLDDELNDGAGTALDAFVIKVSPGGRHIWSTYLGGDASEVATDIAVDGGEQSFVVGRTQSSGWVTGGSDLSYGGSQDGFLAVIQDQAAAEPTGELRIAPTGGAPIWSEEELWRRVGATMWHEGDGAEYWVPVGVHLVELKTVAGWVATNPAPVTIASGQTTYASVNFVRAATLQVTITPPEAAQSGARWRRAGTVPWLASGAKEELPAGDYAIEYKPSPYWIAPTSQTLTLAAGAAGALTGQYSPVDQALSWSTYVGGIGADGAYDCAVDSAGAIYVAGFTLGGDWAAGGCDTGFDGASDGFLAKLSPTGRLQWSTYLGSGGNDYLTGVAVDGAGEICASGISYSADLAAGGYDTALVGKVEAFVAKLAASGELLWSNYLCDGTGSNTANGVACDAEGNIYVCGAELSSSWSADGAWPIAGSYEGFVQKISPSGQQLWSYRIGGTGEERAQKVAVDAAGDVIVAGDFSSTSSGVDTWLWGGFDSSANGNTDGFIVKLSATGSRLWGTCLGGDADDRCAGLAVDANRNIIVTGQTMSPGWGTGSYDTEYEGGDYDGFVLKVSPAGQRIWNAYLGGKGRDMAYGAATDPQGNVFVVGSTQSDDGWIAGGFAPEPGDARFDRSDGFIVKLAPGGQRLWSSYLGGSAWDDARAVAVDTSGTLAVAGYTRSTDWITGGDDTLYGGGSGSSGGDAFVARIDQKINLRVTLTAGAAAAGAQWRLAGATAWRNSGETISGLTAGTACTIEYKAIPNWIAPPNASVTIGAGETNVSATYQPAGSLTVTIAPAAAVSAGAQWRRVGSGVWLASGATDLSAPPGVCTVEFKDLAAQNWLAPPPVSVAIEPGKTTSLAAAYAPRLLVSAVTPLAVPAALGQRVTLTAAAVGAAPLTFQWTKNGVPIAGATGLSLTLAACRLADEGAYACVAHNPYAQASSPEFRVTVHNGSGVIAYLLGQTASTAGLDLNGDGQVTIADALKGVRMTPPATPSGPSPGSGATGLSIKPRLDWADSVDAASYDLYVWKSSASRPAAPTASGLRASQYDVSTALAYGTTYKWQVVARRPEGAATASGPVWSFTTAKAPAGAPK